MKKKIFICLLLGLVLFNVNSVVFASDISSCDTAITTGVLIDEKIPQTVSAIINVIKIAVPVLLVIFGMLDLFKGITSQKEDEIKKGQQLFIKRLISGALVFFVFLIVQLIISFVADKNENANIMKCVDCFINNECEYK